jgi:glc operon protein GlcG
VIASRRDGPGQCEIHTEDTDVIYVQEGSTTFVTGGTCIDPKQTEPGEIRGSGIRDGDARKLEKGDVVIVPHGTPHWFKELSAPVLYYVVKVR